MKTDLKPIAIVGAACRFPGGIRSLDGLWDVLKGEIDAVSAIDASRFGTDVYLHPDKREPGRSYTFAAGVLDDVRGFDAGFFGISPREAEQMDPQQRLLLELAWEAIEDANHRPVDLAGSDCAVFIGIASKDYGDISIDDPSLIDAYAATGNTSSIASNRVSYVFDLRGPSMSIDTACSSALVALHQACQSVWHGEASMALAGGVNLLLHPQPFISFSKASMLSPTGRCRAFDAAGDGYVRAEGGALVLLKPLATALAAGDRIHGIIRATGVNCDGHSHGGITVPGSETQAELLRRVLGRAGIKPDELAYIEAHGTGTPVGDPIEARALGEAIGRHRHSDNPLLIGSVKTNLGHLETASGMAGLLKVLLCLRHRAVPRTLHYRTPNPSIDFPALNLRVADRLTALPRVEGRRLLMGVNSFGFGGANAHVLVEAPSPQRMAKLPAEPAGRRPLPLILSGHGEPAVRELAGRYAAVLAGSPMAEWNALAWNAGRHRQWLERRAIVVADSLEEARVALTEYSRGGSTPQVVSGDAVAREAKLALLFSGNGSQWSGMARQLVAEDATFRESVEEVDAIWRRHADFSLVDELRSGVTNTRLELTEVAQPLLFAIQVGIVRILERIGIRYGAVAGHSVGEVAAAWAAGALTLDQAVKVVFVRSEAQGRTRGAGRMAAVGMGVAEVSTLLDQFGLGKAVDIAGINSPKSVTLSGSLADLERFGDRVARGGVFFQLLDLDYAFHSRHMDGVRQRVVHGLSGLRPHALRIPFVSAVTGTSVNGNALGAGYWWDNIRRPVRFADAIGSLIADGTQLFLEVGPHSILRGYVSQCLQAADVRGQVLPTLKRNNDSSITLRNALFGAIAAGAPIDPESLFPGYYPLRPLPAYPWQKQICWQNATPEGHQLAKRVREHPLLGYRLKDAPRTWENPVDPVKFPYLADHVVDGAVVFPGAAYIEMALAAARLEFGDGAQIVDNLEIRAPAVFQSRYGKIFRFSLSPQDGAFVIESRNRLTRDAWIVNAVGRILVGSGATATDLDGAQAAEAGVDFPAYRLYELATRIGLEFGTAFRAVESLRVSGRSAWSELVATPAVLDDFDPFVMHPVLIDAGFHSILGIMTGQSAQADVAYLPVQMGRIECFGRGVAAQVVARLERINPLSLVASFDYRTADGELLARFRNCRFRQVALGGSRRAKPDAYEFRAVRRPLAEDQTRVSIPAPAAILERIDPREGTADSAAQRRKHFEELLLLDVLASAYAFKALDTLGLVGGRRDPADILLAGEIDWVHQPLLYRLIAMAEQDGLVAWLDGHLVAGSEELPPVDELWLSILGESPGHVAELTLLMRCGEALPELLRGRRQGHDLLEEAGGTMKEHLFDASPTWQAVRRAAKSYLCQIAAAWPRDRSLRVLELGGPAAPLLHGLAAELADRDIDYVLAGNESFVAQLEPLRAACPYARAVVSDIDAGLAEIAAFGPFDVVIGAGAFGMIADKGERLAELRGMLAPAGHLVLAEAQPGRLADLVFGIEPSWWTLGADGLLPGRLLDHAGWKRLLEETGYQDGGHWLEDDVVLEGTPCLVAARSLGAASVDAPASTADAEAATRWVLVPVSRSAPYCRALENALASRGSVTSVEASKLAQCLEELNGDDGPVHVVGLFADIAASDAADGAEPCLFALDLVRGIQRSGQDQSSRLRLSLVTAGGAPLWSHDRPLVAEPVPSQAAVWGFGRVVMNEMPALATRLIDLEPGAPTEDRVARLVRELTVRSDEAEVCLGESGRFVARMMLRTPPLPEGAPVETRQQVLGFTAPGSLKNLQWQDRPRPVLGADQVEVAPVAVGLNFRDVMYAIGLLSEEAVEGGFAGPTMGMEFAGRVVRVGPGVVGIVPGDEVMGFAPACFASRLVTRAATLSPKPANWTFDEAATVPVAFFTAYYALHHLAHLQAGERVLIHGAAGGVGLAAIQLARRAGAEIFATAGSDQKREIARRFGARHVLDSRSLDFADRIMELTDGHGVDVVLNSLAGEAMVRSIAVLKPFGRFLELGKRDFYENSRIGLRPFRNNVSYFGIDADQLLIARPRLAQQLFAEVMEVLVGGEAHPLPHRVFPASRVQDAFRYMQHSRQIGKVVVSMAAGLPQANVAAPPAALRLDGQGTWVVFGGTGGLGFATACWLVEQGARHLVLAGRRGEASAEQRAVLARLEAYFGAAIAVRTCDMTDLAAVTHLFDEIDAGAQPLTGVVHSAMHIADGLIANQTAEKFREVLDPKVRGAWNLHVAAEGRALRHFVLYSSVTTFLGNPGQANYVAANAYLESLVALRRRHGLPGTFMAWGPIDDVGYLSRNKDTRQAIQGRIGAASITSSQALRALGQALAAGRPGEALLWLDWDALRRVMPAAQSPKYERLSRQNGGTRSDGGSDDLRRKILDMEEGKAAGLVRDHLVEEIARILHLPKDKIATDRPATDLGLDSLMGMELGLAVEEAFGVKLPVMAISEGASIASLARDIVARVRDEAGVVESDDMQEIVAATAARHGVAASAGDIGEIAQAVRTAAPVGAGLPH